MSKPSPGLAAGGVRRLSISPGPVVLAVLLALASPPLPPTPSPTPPLPPVAKAEAVTLPPPVLAVAEAVTSFGVRAVAPRAADLPRARNCPEPGRFLLGRHTDRLRKNLNLAP